MGVILVVVIVVVGSLGSGLSSLGEVSRARRGDGSRWRGEAVLVVPLPAVVPPVG